MWVHSWCVYSQVCEEDGRIGTVRLDVLHGVPLVDAGLVGGHPALVVADPGQEQAAWVVVVAAGHIARFVERLEGGPEAHSEEEDDKSIKFDIYCPLSKFTFVSGGFTVYTAYNNLCSSDSLQKRMCQRNLGGKTPLPGRRDRTITT